MKLRYLILFVCFKYLISCLMSKFLILWFFKDNISNFKFFKNLSYEISHIPEFMILKSFRDICFLRKEKGILLIDLVLRIIFSRFGM